MFHVIPVVFFLLLCVFVCPKNNINIQMGYCYYTSTIPMFIMLLYGHTDTSEMSVFLLIIQ